MSTVESKCIECGHPFLVHFPDTRETGLDVERLARSVWTWRYGDRAWRDGGGDERDSTYIAEHIAREYAALRSPDTEEGG